MTFALDLRADARAHMPTLPAHDPALRAAAIATWRARMVNEWSSARVFEALGAQIREASLGDEWSRACVEFAGEERRHGVLCGAVVEALGGVAQAEAPTPARFPQHADATRKVAVLRNVVSVCCMSETVAVALIGAERIEMAEAHPRGADERLTQLLTCIHADEIGHARFGWRLLEQTVDTLSPDERAALRAYLPTALAHLTAHELSHLPDRDGWRDGAPLGLCSGRDARELFHATVRDVIAPGLDRVLGVNTVPS